MALPPELITLAHYMAGEFDNQQQAIADPVWYVHLRLWQRPVPLFTEDSLTLFAEQANIVNLDRPYRPRLLRLRLSDTLPASLQVQYYMFKDSEAICGAGRHPELLKQLTIDQIEFLPSCTLTVQQRQGESNSYEFSTSSATGSPCCFTYQGNTYQVSLGFEATKEEFRSYDKGIDPTTGKAIWGALLGPFRFTKCQDFAHELAV
ncbi:MAG TPA: chorismate mutase [Cyanobacteria bacterium UBA8803]|nr:chorismate mutase [Cyanobacteria bacterium UBA9273]HBL60156.1 chorismate mutase [Cyanobacteria bacterium UBA8803]